MLLEPLSSTSSFSLALTRSLSTSRVPVDLSFRLLLTVDPNDTLYYVPASFASSCNLSNVDEGALSDRRYPPLSDMERQMVVSFIANHINEFVDVPKTASGTFYVTDVEWYTDNTAIVTSEDGVHTVLSRLTATVKGEDIAIVQFADFSVE